MHRFMWFLILWIIAPAATATSQFTFISQPGDWIGQGQSRSFDESSARFRVEVAPDLTTITVSLISNDQSEWWDLSLDGPAGTPLAVGHYPNASRYPFNAPDSNGMAVSGPGRGCNTLRGEFAISALRFAPTGGIELLDATFSQMCEGFMPPLEGRVVIDKRPIAALEASIAILPSAHLGTRSVAHIGGETTCSGADEIGISGTVRQGSTVRSFALSMPCGASSRFWHAPISGLKKGWADVTALATVRRGEDSFTAEASQRVRLTR